jgi:hypothetical protein
MGVVTIENLFEFEARQETSPPPFVDFEMMEPLLRTDEEAKPRPLIFPSIEKRPARLHRVIVRQCDSVTSSVGAFVSRYYSDLPDAIAVFQVRSSEALRFYLVLSRDDDDVLKSAFDLERFFYLRFQDESLDFTVLPGADLEDEIPSEAGLVWRR